MTKGQAINARATAGSQLVYMRELQDALYNYQVVLTSGKWDFAELARVRKNLLAAIRDNLTTVGAGDKYLKEFDKIFFPQ